MLTNVEITTSDHTRPLIGCSFRRARNQKRPTSYVFARISHAAHGRPCYTWKAVSTARIGKMTAIPEPLHVSYVTISNNWSRLQRRRGRGRRNKGKGKDKKKTASRMAHFSY